MYCPLVWYKIEAQIPDPGPHIWASISALGKYSNLSLCLPQTQGVRLSPGPVSDARLGCNHMVPALTQKACIEPYSWETCHVSCVVSSVVSCGVSSVVPCVVSSVLLCVV